MTSCRWLLHAIAAALPCAGCGPAAPATDAAGYQVSGGFLRDPQGRALLLRGMNLSGMHKYAPYFDFHTVPDYRRVRDPWGMNAARFLLTWAAVEPMAGAYDEAYLDALARRMEWAREAGLFVVLDMHQDVYGEGFASGGGDGAPKWTCDAAHYAAFMPDPSQWFLNYYNSQVIACYDHFWQSADLRGRYVAAWAKVAARLAGYDDVILGFDPMNEPFPGSHAISTFEPDLLQPLYEDVIAAVRAQRPGWIAFVEPAASRNLGVPTSLTTLSAANVVYAPHSYEGSAEAGMGFDPARRAAVIENAAALASEAAGLGAALWIGEYGGMTSSPGIAAYMDAEYAAFGAVGAGSAYWDYSKGGSYSVLAADGSEKPELLPSLVRPWPERVAGTPVSYEFDPDTATFTLRYHADAGIAAPTIISVPGRAYPMGYQVECGGCTSVSGAGELEIREPPPGDPAGVTIRPN